MSTTVSLGSRYATELADLRLRHGIQRSGLVEDTEGAVEGIGQPVGIDGPNSGNLQAAAADDLPVHRHEVVTGDGRDALRCARRGTGIGMAGIGFGKEAA